MNRQKKPEKLSIIVSTYNATEYLQQVLKSLNQQTDLNFEVIVADDGSDESTAEIINEFKNGASYPLFHAWHEDKGFRLAASRNNAILKSTGDYIVFLDGDCMVFSDFVRQHRQSAESGYMLRGSRVMLSESFTKDIFAGKKNLPVTFVQWAKLWFSKGVNRISPLLNLRLPRYNSENNWRGVKTCNLGMWRQDLYAVNGYDERYVGWGREDSDLAVRLFRLGIRRKEGRNQAVVIHLWHRENDRSNLSVNDALLEGVINSDVVEAKQGLKQRI